MLTCFILLILCLNFVKCYTYFMRKDNQLIKASIQGINWWKEKSILPNFRWKCTKNKEKIVSRCTTVYRPWSLSLQRHIFFVLYYALCCIMKKKKEKKEKKKPLFSVFVITSQVKCERRYQKHWFMILFSFLLFFNLQYFNLCASHWIDTRIPTMYIFMLNPFSSQNFLFVVSL